MTVDGASASRRGLDAAGTVAFAALVAVFVADGGKNPSVWALCAPLLAAAAALVAWRADLSAGSLHGLGPAWLGFFAWGLASAARSPCPAAAWPAFAKAGAAAAFGFVAYFTWDARHRRWFESLLLAAGAAQALLAIWAGARGDAVPLVLPGNPQYAAFWTAAAALFALARAADGNARAGSARRIGYAIFFGALLLSLAALRSRSGLLALACGLPFWAAHRLGRRAALAAAAGALALFLFLPGGIRRSITKSDDPLAWKRAEIWTSAVRGIAAKPLLGWGPGQFETLYRRYRLPQDGPVRYGVTTAFAHNELLESAAEWGVPATVFLLWGLGFLLASWKPSDGGSTAAKAGLAAAGVFGLFNFPMTLPADAFLAAALISYAAPGASPPRAGNDASAARVVALAAVFAILAAQVRVIAVDGWRALARNPGAGSAAAEEADRLMHEPSDKPGAALDAAAARLRAAVARCPGDADAWHQLAHLASAHRKPPESEEAGRAFQSALLWHPTQAAWTLDYARFLDDERNPEGALAMTRAALRLEPEYAAAHFELARLARIQGRPADGERILSRLLARQDPAPGATPYEDAVLALDRRRAGLELARCLLAQGRNPEALAETRRSSADGDVEQTVLEAEILFRMGDKARSVEHLKRAIALDPASPALKSYLERVQRSGKR